MNSKPLGRLTLETPADYQIKVQGWLDDSWSNHFSGLDIDILVPDDKNPITVLSGQVIDQAALVGIINNLYELHLPILSVKMKSKL